MSVTSAHLPTACVTGASSGIGAAFARQLAAQGYALILTARRTDRLQALATDLTSLGAPAVDVWPADLNQPDQIHQLASRLQERSEAGQLDLLVNNAGFGQSGSFAALPVEDLQQMAQVHVGANLLLTRAVLPGMLRQGQGGIILVSSMAAFLPLPHNSIYSATKAFLNNLAQTVALEIRGSGVHIQALCPGLTRSEFHQTMGMTGGTGPNWLWMGAEAVVTSSLRALRRGQVVHIPGLGNRLLIALARLTPDPLLAWVIGRFYTPQTR